MHRRELHHAFRGGAGHYDPALTLAEKGGAHWHRRITRKVDVRAARVLGVGDAALSRRPGQSAIAAIVRGGTHAGPNRVEQRIDDSLLTREIAGRWRTGHRI